MPAVTFDVMKGTATVNHKSFPMYIGFLSAVQIHEVAEVPHFGRTKEHHKIADTISHPPIDEWQRPLDPDKAAEIKATYDDTQKNNIMANPVLLGYSNLSPGASRIDVSPKIVPTSSGRVNVPNVYTIKLDFPPDKKPLWILDGQHRIEGLRLTTSQKGNPVPFVLLYDTAVYTPPDMARIFTQVTTKATPMEPLHKEWMNYAFQLGRYSQECYKLSMDAVILLCREANLGGANNPFNNRIQFNPYLRTAGYYAFSFDCIQWVDLVNDYYYSKVDQSNRLGPSDLACQIVQATRALQRVDTYAARDSALFSSDNTHILIARGFLSGLLSHLCDHSPKSEDEWVKFYCEPVRQFDKSEWDLNFVKTKGSLSSFAGPASGEVATACFIKAFEDTGLGSAVKFSDYLQGVDAEFEVLAFPLTKGGNKASKSDNRLKIRPGGLVPFEVNKGHITRPFIMVRNTTPNCYVLSVEDRTVVPARDYGQAKKNVGLNIKEFPRGQKLVVTTMSYSSDTQNETTIRLDK
jgi:hypothetical protein